MGRISLQNNNKNAGKRAVGLGNILAGVVAFTIVGTGLFVSGCGFQRKAEAAATDTPVVTATLNPTVTPTLKPTEVPTPTPSSTPKIVPELTDEQVQEQMELLGVTNWDEKIDLNNLICIYFVTRDSNGNEIGKFELVKTYKNFSTGRDFMTRLWDDQPIFEYDATNDGKFDIPNQNFVPRFESLKNSEVKKVIFLTSIEKVCKSEGIPYNSISTPLTQKLKKVKESGIIDGSFTYREYAEYYIRSLSEENRVDASDFVGPIEYVAPTPSTSLSPTPTATVAPTAFRDGNASVRYLMGERDIDTEMENKTKRM